MSLELVSALAAVGTFVVIAVTAFAALIQLRHMRSSNQLAGLLHTVVVFEDPEFQRKLAWLRNEFPVKLKDPKFLDDLRQPGSISRVEHPELAIADLWEQTGVYIKYGLVSEEAFMDLAGTMVLGMWNTIAEVVKIRREVAGEAYYENFEYLASRVIEWQKKHPISYPRDTPRLLERAGP